MSRHNLHPALQHRGLRFPRSTAEAFRDFTYGACIERPYPSFWQRVVRSLKEVFAA